MDKLDFLNRMKDARNAWEALVDCVDPSRLTQGGVVGAWSIKDLIAHISWHDAQMVGVIEARALVGSDWWGLSTDERNAKIYDLNKDRPLEAVREEAARNFEAFYRGVEQLDSRALVDPTFFRDMPGDWTPHDMFAQNAHEHYLHHVADVNAWLAGQKG